MAYLVRAHVLHRVEIDEIELVAGDERIDPLQGGLEVPKLVKAPKVNLSDKHHRGSVYLPACPLRDKPRGTSTLFRTPCVWTPVGRVISWESYVKFSGTTHVL